MRFESAADGRRHFRELVDAAASGISAQVTRDRSTFAVVESRRLQTALQQIVAAPLVVAEAGGWSVVLPDNERLRRGPLSVRGQRERRTPRSSEAEINR